MIGNKNLWLLCELLHNNPSVVNFEGLSTLIQSNKISAHYDLLLKLEALKKLDLGIKSTLVTLRLEQYSHNKENSNFKKDWKRVFHKSFKEMIEYETGYNLIIFLIPILYGIEGYRTYVNNGYTPGTILINCFLSELDRSEGRLIFEEEMRKSGNDIEKLDSYYTQLIQEIDHDLLWSLPISKIIDDLLNEKNPLNKKLAIYKKYKFVEGKIERLKAISFILSIVVCGYPSILLLSDFPIGMIIIFGGLIFAAASMIGIYLFEIFDKIINQKNYEIRELLIKDFYSSDQSLAKN
jgi:hypothetical protein